MDRFEQVKQRIDKFNKDRDWDKFHSPSNLSKSISIEANELLECFQWNDNEYDVEQVKEELADVMNYCIQMSQVLDVDIVDIIRPLGNMHKKSQYIVEIANRLMTEQDGKVPCDREYLESLPGVGRKTANVILATLFNAPAFAVDTHIERVAKRLKIAKPNDSVLEVEKKLMKFYNTDEWNKAHLQVLLFGRYICKSKNPLCETCKLKEFCTNSKRI